MSSTIATSATGGSASSQADCLDGRAWNPRPIASWSVRILVLLLPLVAAVGVVKTAIVLVSRPDGRVVFWTWMAALAVVSFIASLGTQRLMRRVAPLAMLFRMSLIFPDEAPSRFSSAMRSGSSRSLARHFQSSDTKASPQQAAAEQLLALITRLGRHDRLTRGHAERVRAYSVMLGEQIGLSRDDLDKLNWAALVHDIGKLEVPEALLNKPGRPTGEEWTMLRTHPAAGSKYVEPLRAWLGEWVDATTQHHERYDGDGYPQGLSGKGISLAGRIVAIADAYDVMTAARSYKKPLPAAQARAELTRSSGTQFDPHLVRSFVEISLGRMRRIVGPLGWLSQLPELIRSPLTAIATSTTGVVAAGAIGLATAAGALAAPAEPRHQTVETAPYVQQLGDPVDGSTTPSTEPVSEPTGTTAPSSAIHVRPVAPNERVPTAVAATTTTASNTTTASTTSSTSPTASTTTTPAQISPVNTTTSPATPTTNPATPTGPTSPGITPPTTASPTTPVPATAVPSTTAVTGPATAVDDQANTRANKSVNIHVLQNDNFGASSPDMSTFSVLAGPSHGSVTVVGQNLLYDPDPGYTGTDSFSYSICSLSASCGQATVLVTITP